MLFISSPIFEVITFLEFYTFSHVMFYDVWAYSVPILSILALGGLWKVASGGSEKLLENDNGLNLL